MERPPRLSATFVRTVTAPGRYGDGRGSHGLSLLVKAGKVGVRKSFSQRLGTADGLVQIGLGSYPAVTLDTARERAFDNARAVREGRGLMPERTARAAPAASPVRERRDRRSVAPTFAQAAEATLAGHLSTWKDGSRTASLWRYRLAEYAYPVIGELPVAAVTTADVYEVVMPVWTTRRETARKLLQHVRAVMAWAVVQGYRRDNPAAGDAIGSALPRSGGRVQHLRAVPHTDVPAVLAIVRDADAYPVTKLAVEFLILTACRSGEVRGARWGEIDADAATWTIPASRMKAEREHRVPLSGAALTVLHAASEHADSSELVFPSPTGKMLADGKLSTLFRELGIAGTPHGMRSSFRDWAAECSDAPREIAEMALAHIEGSAAELAYRRTDYFEKRRELMQAWAGAIAA